MAKRRRKKHLREEETTALALLAAVFFYIVTRAVVVLRTGVEGAAYFFAAYQLLLFVLLLFPLPLSEALYELIPLRHQKGRYRNGKYLYNAAVVLALLYTVAVGLLWSVFSERLSLRFLLGRYNTLAMLILLGVFVLDLVFLILRGYLQSLPDSGLPLAMALLARQLAGFFLVLFFAGVLQKNGEQVSRLLKNSEVGYAYGAAGVAVGTLATAAVGAVSAAALYTRCLGLIRSGIRSDSYKYREPSGSILLRGALPIALAGASISGAELFLMGRYLRLMNEAGSAALLSYQWGIYSGICHTALLMPVLLAALIVLPSFTELRVGFASRARQEVYFRLQGLFSFGMMLALIFSAYVLACAPLIAKGFFGTDALLAVRLLRLSALLIPPAVYAVMSLLVLYAGRQTPWTALYVVAALGVAMLVWRVLLTRFPVAVYGLLAAEGCFLLGLSVANFFRLQLLTGLGLPGLWQSLCVLGGGLIGAVLGGLGGMLFSLFLPSFLAAVLAFLLCFIGAFIVYALSGCLKRHILSVVPLGRYLRRLGRALRVMR